MLCKINLRINEQLQFLYNDEVYVPAFYDGYYCHFCAICAFFKLDSVVMSLEIRFD